MTRGRSLLLAACLALPACSGKPTPPGVSDTLQDYSVPGDHRVAPGQSVLARVDPALMAGRYKQVYIEPSRFYPAPTPSERITPSTLINISGYYDAVLRRELGRVMTVVERPAPDTLVVRPAITRIAVSTQGLRFYEWLPVTLVAAGVSTVTGLRDQDSEIATQVSLEAGTSGRIVAQMISSGTGTPLDNDRQVLTAHNVRRVLDGWANDLRLALMAQQASSR